jgi:hypothetical protein
MRKLASERVGLDKFAGQALLEDELPLPELSGWGLAGGFPRGGEFNVYAHPHRIDLTA